MSLFQAFVLAFVQGLTEFIPVSSSGHLVVVADLLNLQDQGLFFDLMVHLGTGLALLVYFRKDLIHMVRCFRDWWLVILIGILPAATVGFLLRGWFENNFRSPLYVALFLFLGSMLMLGAEVFLQRRHNLSDSEGPIEGEKLSVTKSQALVVGLFQVLPLFSGFSRSGSTISGGIFVGLGREVSARFSFLLSIPLVFGAGLYELMGSSLGTYTASELGVVGFGMVVSFLTGLACISFLMRYLKKNTLIPFVVYRLVLVLLVLVFVV
jgi:undecaprenyl-diphosphatase